MISPIGAIHESNEIEINSVYTVDSWSGCVLTVSGVE